jgi:hypothetical protein
VKSEKNARRSTVIWYVPFRSLSLSFRPYSFVKVGRPAVRIQFWKCSSSLRRGMLLLLYVSPYFSTQFGGGTISDGS